MAEERQIPAKRHGSRDTSELGTHGGPQDRPGYPGRASEGRDQRDKDKSPHPRGVTRESPIHSR